MPSPTTNSANFCTLVPAAFSICSIVCLSFFTNGWFSSDTSFRYFCTLPSTIFATISAGLPPPAYQGGRPGVSRQRRRLHRGDVHRDVLAALLVRAGVLDEHADARAVQ